MKGRYWVLIILGLGAAAAGIALFYWRVPETRVAWSFTQLHGALLRGKRDIAETFVASRVNGKSREEFLKEYKPLKEATPIDVTRCPKQPDHWQAAMRGEIFCFLLEEKIWKLHWIGPAPCGCE